MMCLDQDQQSLDRELSEILLHIHIAMTGT